MLQMNESAELLLLTLIYNMSDTAAFCSRNTSRATPNSAKEKHSRDTKRLCQFLHLLLHALQTAQAKARMS